MIDTSLLNENQKQAVLDDAEYLRIVAGAGSGKTRVLTMRIVHLIEDEGVYPNKILAITFTNKAANEMKERIHKMLKEDVGQPWISTIHSLCVRILREDIGVLGWPRNFTVLDSEDQKSILKEAYKKLDVDSQMFPYASLLDYISNNKTSEITPGRAMEIAGTFSGEKLKAQIYDFYVKRQEALYGLDFDDLIVRTVQMFRKYDEVLAKWQRRFHYIHVDEFQDIDHMQYQLIRQLAGSENHLYVVGDPDQTIYTWRGADVNIILNFVKDFPDAHTIMLNENYRSTSSILNGANSVIKNNKHRLQKELFTSRKSTEKITHYAAPGDEFEAMWVAEKIAELHAKGKPYHDMAVLYRSNYLSRSLEKGLLDLKIPYIIYGGVRFYDRQEVKDALCYLRMVTTGDDLAFTRIINRPKRGIGNKTLDAIRAKSEEENRSMFEVIEDEKLFSGKVQNTLNGFVEMVERWRGIARDGKTKIYDLFEQVMDESGLRKSLEADNETERLENLKELIDDVREFSENYPESSIEEYLQLVSLYGDRDSAQQADCVQLMTVHAAKGLEFDTVFVTDMNDGIFPNARAMNDGSRGLEEERRLAYVAFTRARNKLYITEAGGYSYILQMPRTSSRFIKEIDPDCIEHIGTGFQQKKSSPFLTQEDEETHFVRHEKKAAPAAHYHKGDLVAHAKFGEGVVLKCDGPIVEVAFPYPWGVKKIASSFPGLKKKAQA